MHEATVNTIPPVPVLASIEAMGRHLAALERAYDAADEGAYDPNHTHDALVILDDQAEAAREMIASALCETLGDAAVQIRIAAEQATSLRAPELDPAGAQRYPRSIERMLLGILPVVTRAAGLSAEEMNFGEAYQMREQRFAALLRPLPPPTNPDAELLASAAEYGLIIARMKEDTAGNAEFDRLVDSRWDVALRMLGLPAATPAGAGAKAAVALSLMLSQHGDGAGVVDDDADNYIKLAIEALQDAVRVLPAGAPVASPDASLIADCAAFDALVQAYCAAVDQDDERERISDLQAPIVTRMVEARATTPEGHRARARSLIGWAPDLVKEGAGNTDQMLLHALLRDLLGATAPSPNSDADLFRLVAEFEAAHAAYWKAEEGDSPARDAAAAARIEAAKALAAAKPATPAGHAARAAAALRCSGGFVPDNPAEGLSYLPPGLVLAVLRDLVGAGA